MCVHQWWMCKYGICLLNTKFKVREDSSAKIKFIYTDWQWNDEAENWRLTAAVEQKHLSMPLHWEWTSLSRVSYPWNICNTHIQHRQSRKKQRSKDSCRSLMTLSSFEWVPFTKESFHITAWNPFRQYDGHLRSASTRILWLWVGFEKHNTHLSAELSAGR